MTMIAHCNSRMQIPSRVCRPHQPGKRLRTCYTATTQPVILALALTLTRGCARSACRGTGAASCMTIVMGLYGIYKSSRLNVVLEKLLNR
jgi:hypothetical protein